MAKLNDGKEWLSRVLGDEPRANSLIKIGRDDGLFTKSKRGGNAPDLVLSDFAYLALIAVMSVPPTKLSAGMKDVMQLRLTKMDIDLGDGDGWRSLDLSNLHPDALSTLSGFGFDWSQNQELRAVSPFFVLHLLFMNFTPSNDFHDWDRIELIERGEYKHLTLMLHEKDYVSSTWSDDGAGGRSLLFSFGNGKDFEHDMVVQHRTMYGDGLNGIAAMTKWMAEGENA